MAIIIDGKKTANEILENLKEKTKSLAKKPHLAVILASDDSSIQAQLDS